MVKTKIEQYGLIKSWDGWIWWGSQRRWLSQFDFAVAVVDGANACMDTDDITADDAMARLVRPVYLRPCVGRCNGESGDIHVESHVHPFTEKVRGGHLAWELDLKPYLEPAREDN